MVTEIQISFGVDDEKPSTPLNVKETLRLKSRVGLTRSACSIDQLVMSKESGFYYIVFKAIIIALVQRP